MFYLSHTTNYIPFSSWIFYYLYYNIIFHLFGCIHDAIIERPVDKLNNVINNLYWIKNVDKVYNIYSIKYSMLE